MNKRSAPSKTLLMFVIPCLCFTLLAFLTLHYVIAVPILDQWELVPLLQKSYQGQLAFGDLWAQHNEHRLLFPRLIMLGLARLSHWDLRWELVTSLLLAVGILSVVGIQLRQTAKIVKDDTLLRLLPVASIVVFSLRQSENWMWGWQLAIFLNILAVVAGIALLTHPAPTWGKWIGAVCCGVVATYSFANGLLFWPLGAFALWANTRDSTFRARMAGWCVCAVLTAASYFYQYAKPPDSPPLLYTLSHPFTFAAYFLSYIGAFISIKDTPVIGVCMGLVGLALLILAWRSLRQNGKIPPEALTPYLAYALYVLLSALVSTVGRAGFGAKQAMASRYLTISELFWIAILVMGYLTARQREATQTSAQTERWARRVLVVAGLVFAVNSLKNIRAFPQQYAFAQPVERQMLLLNYKASAKLSLTPNVVEERAPFLRQHRLALYRGDRRYEIRDRR